MQIVPEEVSSIGAAVAVVDSEERSFGPVLHIRFIRRLHDIQNDGHPVFIVVPHNPLVCVGAVGFYYSVPFYTAFGRFVVGQHYFCRVWKLLAQELNCLFVPKLV